MQKISLMELLPQENKLDKNTLIKKILIFIETNTQLTVSFLEYTENIFPDLYYLNDEMVLKKDEFKFNYIEKNDITTIDNAKNYRENSFFKDNLKYITYPISFLNKNFGELIFKVEKEDNFNNQKDLIKIISKELSFILDYLELKSLKEDAIDSLIKETQKISKQESELIKLKEENKYLKYEQNDFGVIILDFDLKIKYINPYLKNLLELKKYSELGKILSQEEVYSGNFINFLNKIAETGNGGVSTISLITYKTGKELQFKTSANILSSNDFFLKLFNITSEVNLTKKYANLKNKFDKLLKAEIEDTLKTSDLVLLETLKFFENKDEDFGNHLERISEYSYVIAKDIFENNINDNIDQDYLQALPRAAALHDIGMLSIKESILFKDSKLTKEEFEAVKSHTTTAAYMIDKILKKYPNSIFLKLLKEITLGHHERYNGSGYPYGLKGKQIPLSARIVALADIFDGLTTDRIYKKGLKLDIARMMIVDYKGKLLDPDIVEIYLRNENKFIEIFNKYKLS